jgi:hypothetical protein
VLVDLTGQKRPKGSQRYGELYCSLGNHSTAAYEAMESEIKKRATLSFVEKSNGTGLTIRYVLPRG